MIARVVSSKTKHLSSPSAHKRLDAFAQDKQLLDCQTRSPTTQSVLPTEYVRHELFVKCIVYNDILISIFSVRTTNAVYLYGTIIISGCECCLYFFNYSYQWNITSAQRNIC
jgi:hypothetical protein